ncbi:hypothetical protein AVEN_88841-1 [Araneus ventricosus]|uniref:Uncharacterized protein n=1 Tax=Araneus ventricosus TaxID=182803 RepID=A0A4Y2HTA2_ARAVE|nr:hypothetical protein AVEN_88841-1 [Araneus ventricosus]
MIYTQIIQLKDRLHERTEHEELHRERYDIRMRTSVKRYKIGLIAEPEEPTAALENGAYRSPLVWRGSLERGVPAEVSSSSSDRGSKLRGPSQNSPRVASKRTLI